MKGLESVQSCIQKHQLLVICLLALVLPFMPGESAEAEGLMGSADLTPPLIAIMSPLPDNVSADQRPRIVVEIFHDASRIERRGVVLSLNGIEITADADFENLDGDLDLAKSWKISYRPPKDLAPGDYLLQVDARDLEGNGARQQLRFTITGEERRSGLDLGMTNTLSYDLAPLSKMRDTTSVSAGLGIGEQRFSLQLRTNLTDYPGTRLEPIFGRYYLSLDQYALTWQNRRFTLRHGKINVPFQSGLIQFGLGFEGTHLTTAKWSLFRGRSGSSVGLGMSVVDSSGAVYEHSGKKGDTQVYVLLVDSAKTKVLGIRNERASAAGTLRSEVAYGLGPTNGGTFMLQGGAMLAGIILSGDFLLVQDSFPLAGLSPLSSSREGAYRFTVSGTKLLPENRKLSLGFAQGATNLNRSSTVTPKSQSLSLGFSGQWGPECTWQVTYQGSRHPSTILKAQHSFRAGLQSKLAAGKLTSSVSMALDGANKSQRFQWNAGYSREYADLGAKTASTLTYSNRQSPEAATHGWRLRWRGEKLWFDDRLNTSLQLDYEKDREKLSTRAVSTREALSLSGSTQVQIGQRHSLTIHGKASFWRTATPATAQGIDYSLGFALTSILF